MVMQFHEREDKIIKGKKRHADRVTVLRTGMTTEAEGGMELASLWVSKTLPCPSAHLYTLGRPAKRGSRKLASGSTWWCIRDLTKGTGRQTMLLSLSLSIERSSCFSNLPTVVITGTCWGPVCPALQHICAQCTHTMQHAECMQMSVCVSVCMCDWQTCRRTCWQISKGLWGCMSVLSMCIYLISMPMSRLFYSVPKVKSKMFTFAIKARFCTKFSFFISFCLFCHLFLTQCGNNVRRLADLAEVFSLEKSVTSRLWPEESAQLRCFLHTG